MRKRIRAPHGPPFKAAALRAQTDILFRRVADRDLAVLAIGALERAEEPRFNEDGRASDWWFGHLSYGYKDRLEPLTSRCEDVFNWPLSHWFVPRWVIEWSGGDAWLHAYEEDVPEGLEILAAMRGAEPGCSSAQPVAWQGRTAKDAYSQRASELLIRIQRGDIYEVNYCVTHEAGAVGFDPFAAFDSLLVSTDAPFAAFARLGGRYALCCSPERFIAFDGDRMRGEPMKGTRPRGVDPVEDDRLRSELADDAKERSENVMAVDVMRNDFSRVALPGSVRVPELFGVRTHPRVHQLVSVVEGRRAPSFTPFDAVRAAFPPASMTGAPKISAMKLIDEAEDFARGLYSGTLGYFAPDGTADLNVVIRTVLYDEAGERLAIPAGSALTALCDPEAEWQECLVKFNSIAHGLAAAR